MHATALVLALFLSAATVLGAPVSTPSVSTPVAVPVPVAIPCINVLNGGAITALSGTSIASRAILCANIANGNSATLLTGSTAPGVKREEVADVSAGSGNAATVAGMTITSP